MSVVTTGLCQPNRWSAHCWPQWRRSVRFWLVQACQPAQPHRRRAPWPVSPFVCFLVEPSPSPSTVHARAPSSSSFLSPSHSRPRAPLVSVIPARRPHPPCRVPVASRGLWPRMHVAGARTRSRAACHLLPSPRAHPRGYLSPSRAPSQSSSLPKPFTRPRSRSPIPTIAMAAVSGFARYRQCRAPSPFHHHLCAP